MFIYCIARYMIYFGQLYNIYPVMYVYSSYRYMDDVNR
jgi:hypothetical protein